jgi:hypothetical protein
MNDVEWQHKFQSVYQRGVQAWRANKRSPETMFDSSDKAFLESIGCTAQELFDFIDDQELYGEPDYPTVLAVQRIRKDYLNQEMKGQSSGHVASMDDLPAKTDAVEGIAWLPRLIVKARLKLRGEMPSELMYGCGGDRPFLQEVGITLPEFLTLVREHGEDDSKIVAAVQASLADKR